MLKQRIIKVMVSLALLAALMGSYGIVADSLGHTVTAQAHACGSTQGSGGGC